MTSNSTLEKKLQEHGFGTWIRNILLFLHHVEEKDWKMAKI